MTSPPFMVIIDAVAAAEALAEAGAAVCAVDGNRGPSKTSEGRRR